MNNKDYPREDSVRDMFHRFRSLVTNDHSAAAMLTLATIVWNAKTDSLEWLARLAQATEAANE